MSFKQNLIGAGFGLFRATRLHRLAGGFFRGRGVILTFHRVRPAGATGFSPNGLLEITPEFLDLVLALLDRNGLEIVTLDEGAARLRSGQGAPFVVLTFDDGFRDVVTHGLPVLERHKRALHLLHCARLSRPHGAHVVDGAGGGHSPAGTDRPRSRRRPPVAARENGRWKKAPPSSASIGCCAAAAKRG